MADGLISKELLRMCLDEFMKLTEKTRNEPGAGLMVYAMDGAEIAIRTLRDKLDNFPTVDAVPVVHGRWETQGRDVVCSVCKYIQIGAYRVTWHSPYCPSCGAKMTLKECEETPNVHMDRSCIEKAAEALREITDE